MYEDAILTNDHRAHNATTVQTQADWNRWEGVLREAYLASRMRQHGLTYSIQRFTLHEWRATKNATADRRLQQKCSWIMRA